MKPTDSKKPDADEEPWVFVVEGRLRGEWDVDGSWMMLDGIDPPEEVEELKQVAIQSARNRRATMRRLRAED